MQSNSLISGTVIYDDTCVVCQVFVDYFQKRDVGGKLEFVGYQRTDLDSISPGLTEMMADQAIYFVRRNGTRLRGVQGVGEVLKSIPGLWALLGAALAYLPLRILLEPFYQTLASNRHYASRKIGLRK